MLYPLLSKAAPSTIIEAGSNVDAASYIIFQDAGIIYAKNGMTGKIEFQGNDAATVINSALNNLTTGRTWKERVVIRGNLTIISSILVPSYTIIDLCQARLTLANNANKTMIKNSDQTNGNDYFEICGGILDGNRNNQSSTVNGIDIQGAGNQCQTIRVRNINIINVKGTGLYINGIAAQSTIENVHTRNLEGRGCYAERVFDSILNGLTLNSRHANFYLMSSSSNRISNFYCSGNSQTDLDAMQMKIYGCRNNQFDNIRCDSPIGHGLEIGGAPGYQNLFNNIIVTRPLDNGWDAIKISDQSVRNIFTNIYIGQKGEFDDTIYTFANAIKEYDTSDYNVFANVIAKNCINYFTLIGPNSHM